MISFVFAFALSASASPTRFFPVDDYRHVVVESTDREPESLPPLYRDQSVELLALDLYLGVADRASSAFVRARYRVRERGGRAVDVDTGFRNLGFTEAVLANLAVRIRAERASREAVFANVPFFDYREPMFTEPAVVAFTGDSVANFYHEVSIAMNEEDFNRLDRDFDVELRLKHQRNLHDGRNAIDAHRFVFGRARPRRIDRDEAAMINRLTYLTRCEPGLTAN